MIEKLREFINENADNIFFTEGVNDEKIYSIENALDIKLPHSFKNYLKEYGFIMGFGVEFLGSGKGTVASVVRDTLRYREFGLSKEVIVIRNVDEWVYCLNVLTGSISSWDRNDKHHIFVASDFEEYVLLTLMSAKEDWQN